ncbi:hypothetical protein [Teredinibacter sp. KSP-S5-2]|uniref:hypothetical protein n=1 Tax=Teredinibacter sp. KSP-S5-2 TaxID=3034506 RepID=UPI002934A47C|nr:hypothetical protein [Teredinibacter sp. KSP-S5-2]WNO07760.1 hypothetical protein P5V12_12245 [Teredinibacter sp. KSP-S5-2]
MKLCRYLILMVMVFSPLLLAEEASKPAFTVMFSDASAWNGNTVPQGQQCQRFGGAPSTPAYVVENIPRGTYMLVFEYSDRNYPPMDNGGHGRVGFLVKESIKHVAVPSLPGHSFDLPEDFLLIAEHNGAGWDKAGAYMPPCSGGKGNEYYVTVKAVKKVKGHSKDKILAQQVVELGRY